MGWFFKKVAKNLIMVWFTYLPWIFVLFFSCVLLYLILFIRLVYLLCKNKLLTAWDLALGLLLLLGLL